MYVGNVLLLLLNLPLVGLWVQFLRIPYRVLFPVVLLLSIVGVYSANKNVFDLWVMLGFGVAGYVLLKLTLNGRNSSTTPAPLQTSRAAMRCGASLASSPGLLSWRSAFRFGKKGKQTAFGTGRADQAERPRIGCRGSPEQNPECVERALEHGRRPKQDGHRGLARGTMRRGAMVEGSVALESGECKESAAQCHSAGPRSGGDASHWQPGSEPFNTRASRRRST